MPDDPTPTDEAAEAGTARQSAIARALEVRFKDLLAPLDPALLASARRIVVAVVRAAAHESAELVEYASVVTDWGAAAADDADPARSDIQLSAAESPTPYLAFVRASRSASGTESVNVARLHLKVLLGNLKIDRRFSALTTILRRPRGHPDRRVLRMNRIEPAPHAKAPPTVTGLICEALAPLPRIAPKEQSEPAERPVIRDVGFFEAKARAARFQRRTERAGVMGGARSLCPAHARYVFGALAAALRDVVTARIAAVIYMAVMLGVTPSRFRSIPLRRQPSGLCWLDLDRGFFVYSVAALVQSMQNPQDVEDDEGDWSTDDGQYFAVPIDNEVLAELRRQPSRGTAANLGELLGAATGRWRQDAKDLLRPFSRTGWPVTLTALISVGPRLALADGRDETLFDALFFHAGLGPTANFYYRAFSPEEVADAAGVMWRALGPTGVVATPLRAAWLVEPPTEAQFRGAVSTLLTDANRLLDSVTSPPAAEKVLHLVGEVALLVASVLVLLTGHRGSRIQDLTRNCMFLEHDAPLALVFMAEKYADRVRAVPLVGVVRRAVEAYIALLRTVAFRLRDKDPRLAEAILARLSRASTKALFFAIEDGELIDLASSDVAARLKRFGLRRNDGRRVMPTVSGLRGPLAALVGIWMGRADAGQDALGLESSVILDDALQVIHARAEAGIASWQLPLLRVLRGRWSAKACDTTAALCGVICPTVFKAPLAYTTEFDPPLRRDDAVRYVIYRKACTHMQKHPPKDPLVLLSLLLVVRAGACNPYDVVEFATSAARGLARHDSAGRIYLRGEPEGTRLGLREMIGGPELAAAVARTLSNPAIANLLERINAYLANALGCASDQGLALLCNCASAVMYRFAPRCVVEHARGAMTGRVPTWSSRALALAPSSHVSPGEPPTPGVRRRPKLPLVRDTLLELQPLVGACRRYSDGEGSPNTRKAEFRAEVEALCEDLTQYSVGAQVLMLTADAMAAKGDVGSTVERQVVGELRGFLADVGAREPAALTSLETLRESAERVSEIARDIIGQRVAAGADADNLRAVLGHMRTACDIPVSLGEAPPAAGSSKAVPCLWRDEVADEVRQALLSMDLVEAVKARALALLALVYAAAALRASEVHGLRVRDVAFIAHDVVLSISNPAVNIKSTAGRREVQVAMPAAQATDLRSLVEGLRAAGRDDALLFGDTTAAADGVRAQDVRSVLQAAIAMVAGDARASTLTLRRSAATTQLLAVCLPHEARDADFLHRRQACFSIAIGVGHASIWTTITDYFACMADVLYEHMARRPAGWSADLRAIPLLTLLMGGKRDAAAKRAERHRSTGTSLVLKKDRSGLGNRLDSPVAAGPADDARSGLDAREDRGARLRFLANVLSGMPIDIAGRLDCVLDETMRAMKRKRRSYTPSSVRLSDADRAQILPIANALAPLPDLGSVLDVLLPAGTARGASCVIVGEHNLAQLKLLLQALASICVTTDLRLSARASDGLKAAAAASKVANVLPGRATPSDCADVVSLTFASNSVKGAGAASRMRALVCAALLDLVLFP